MNCLLDHDWAPVPGFKDYVVSTAGRVLSYKRGGWRELQPYIGKNGYKYLNLRKDGHTVRKNIHRIVAETFIDNPESKPAVNHIDGNKLNNNVENLEWVTYRENSRHAIEHGLTTPPDHVLGNEACRTPIVALCLETGEEYHYPSQRAASIDLDITPPHINKVLKGDCPHAKGFVFRYEEDQ